MSRGSPDLRRKAQRRQEAVQGSGGSSFSLRRELLLRTRRFRSGGRSQGGPAWAETLAEPPTSGGKTGIMEQWNMRMMGWGTGRLPQHSIIPAFHSSIVPPAAGPPLVPGRGRFAFPLNASSLVSGRFGGPRDRCDPEFLVGKQLRRPTFTFPEQTPIAACYAVCRIVAIWGRSSVITASDVGKSGTRLPSHSLHVLST